MRVSNTRRSWKNSPEPDDNAMHIRKITNMPVANRSQRARLQRLEENTIVPLGGATRARYQGATMRVILEIGDIPTEVHEVQLLIGPGPTCAVFMKGEAS